MRDLNLFSPAARVLALKMTGEVGPRTFAMLMEYFHTVDNILLAEREELLELPGIGPARSEAIVAADNNLEKAQAVLDSLEASDTKVVSCLNDNYPEILNELNDPPLLLYYQGRLPVDGEKRVAVIGSQEVSAEGIAEAVDIARRLAGKGIAIVGGLARGIDTAGHMGALKADGITYAVLPSGFNQVYPSENQVLSQAIIKSGGLLSEHLPDTPVNGGRLLGRNRLIVGLSHAVVIGEVSETSVGTLDAAQCCQELGKLLFVMVSERTAHYEKLCQYGAIPIVSTEDIDLIVKALI